ncbi:MAG: hypothetical protein IT424_00485 [Pirellulales bacterium]|nr:hypothetical protein [Pirellulales bacterium]
MRRRYIIGCLSGWAVWLVLLAIYYAHAFAATADVIPKVLRPLVGAAAGAIGLAAWPLAMGGWLACGDKYLTIILNPVLNIAIGLALYGALGILITVVLSRRHGKLTQR